MYKKILVAVDGSDVSLKAAKQAADIASKFESEVTLFHVITPLPPAVRNNIFEQRLLDNIMDEGAVTLNKAKAEFEQYDLKVDTDLIVGDPSLEICAKSQEGSYDLVVIGNRGLGALSGFIMGSVSRRVVRHAPCPVLVVR